MTEPGDREIMKFPSSRTIDVMELMKGYTSAKRVDRRS